MNRLKKWFWKEAQRDENNAQTVFRILANLLRCFLAFIALWLVIGLLVSIPAWWSQNWQDRQRELVEISVSYERGESFSSCDAEFPVLVTVTNNSERTVEFLRLVFQAREEGRSSNRLTDVDYKYREWDFIVPAGTSTTACYGFGALTKSNTGADLIWDAEIWSNTIRFTKE